MQSRDSLDYLTIEFVRHECGVFGAHLSDEDCQRIIDEVHALAAAGNFYHTGVYWIANELAAQQQIHPTFPR